MLLLWKVRTKVTPIPGLRAISKTGRSWTLSLVVCTGFQPRETISQSELTFRTEQAEFLDFRTYSASQFLQMLYLSLPPLCLRPRIPPPGLTISQLIY